MEGLWSQNIGNFLFTSESPQQASKKGFLCECACEHSMSVDLHYAVTLESNRNLSYIKNYEEYRDGIKSIII